MFTVIRSNYTGEVFVGSVLTATGRRGWLPWEAEAVLAVRPHWLDDTPYYLDEGE
jgi:hypothetical protein